MTGKMMDGLPQGRRWMAATAVGETVYLTGGDRQGGAPCREVWVCDRETGVVQVSAPLPLAVSGHGCTVLDGKLYVTGGVPKTAQARPCNDTMPSLAAGSLACRCHRRFGSTEQ